MSAMEVTVLGSSGAQPAPGDACSGYLVKVGSTRVLIDCGSGVVSALQRYSKPRDLDMVVISHMHPDHFIDLITLRYSLKYGEQRDSELGVWLPPGGKARLEAIASQVSNTTPFFEGTMNLREYAPDEQVSLDSGTIELIEVQHSMPSFGMRVSSGNDVLAYSSDTVPCEGLDRVSDGATVFMAENALGGGAPQHEPKNHLTSEDAGRVAANAGAGRLLLTHFWPTASRVQCQAEAQSVFAGPVSAASQGLRLKVETTSSGHRQSLQQERVGI